MVDAVELAEEMEHGNRHLKGWQGTAVLLIAGLWSVFQLLIADLVLIDSVTVRCIHLAFALSLVFCSFTAFDRSRKGSIKPVEGVLILLGVVCSLYLAINYDAIALRQGSPTLLDVSVGVVLVLLILEGARRSIGPALSTAAFLFILSSLFASHLPSFIASRDVSLSHLISKLTLSTEGVYGIPLRISADTIFLFVLFGAMLEKSGGGHYFVDLAYTLLGRFRGGPAKAAVLASGMTGLVSGSSIANTVTTGTFTIPLMKKTGYPATKAAAIEVAASTNGQLMPPIMGAAAFIIAEYCNIPYLSVVKAALIPAVVSYLTLIYITHLEALKLGMKPAKKGSLPSASEVFWRGAHFILPLVILIYQLVVLRRSPSSSAYTSILSLAAILWIHDLFIAYKEKESLFDSTKKTLLLLWDSLVRGGQNMMTIGVAVAGAGIIVGVVSLGLGGKVTEVVEILSGGHLLPILFITAVVSLILGMGLPTTANYIVMANLTVPAIVALSAEANVAIPLIAAHLFCFYFGILADDTPPVGLAAYAASAIAKSPPIKTAVQGFLYDMRTAILPFMFIFNTDLLLYNVDSVWWGLVIFVTALAAMMAFASITQGYLLRKNKLHETLLLASTVIILLRPDLFPLSRAPLYVLGLSLFLLTYLLQYNQRKAHETSH